MKHDPNNQSDQQMHAMLGELAELERAGVFSRTPINVEAAVLGEASQGRVAHAAASGSSRGIRRMLFAGKIAACLALVVGAGSLWQSLSNNTPPLTNGNTNMHASASDHSLIADLSGASQLVGCVNGPAGSGVTSTCLHVDLDSDGDIDLADFGALQRRQGRL